MVVGEGKENDVEKSLLGGNGEDSVLDEYPVLNEQCQLSRKREDEKGDARVGIT